MTKIKGKLFFILAFFLSKIYISTQNLVRDPKIILRTPCDYLKIRKIQNPSLLRASAIETDVTVARARARAGEVVNFYVAT